MAEETQYTAITGLVNITTANPNLNGTGTISLVIKSSATNGTLIKSVTIQAKNTTTQGMVRLFLYNGTTTVLFKEIEIPAVTASTIDLRFNRTLNLDFVLQFGYQILASTENAESFNIIAEGMNISYYGTAVRTDTTQYTAITGLGSMSAVNTPYALIRANNNGCSIESITFKATESPVDGIITLQLFDGTTYFLFREIKVTAITHSGIAASYEYNVVFENDFELQSGYSIVATTKQVQLFSVTAEGLNWSYLP